MISTKSVLRLNYAESVGEFEPKVCLETLGLGFQ
jgi:hypothetical protein